jgi:hypothetical protein
LALGLESTFLQADPLPCSGKCYLDTTIRLPEELIGTGLVFVSRFLGDRTRHFYLLFFFSTWNRTQDFLHAKHSLHHWVTCPAPKFYLLIFTLFCFLSFFFLIQSLAM